ncbi:MAG: thioredoxin family protein [Bdellovibrionota bacterium]
MRNFLAALFALVAMGGSALYLGGPEKCAKWLPAFSNTCALLPPSPLEVPTEKEGEAAPVAVTVPGKEKSPAEPRAAPSVQAVEPEPEEVSHPERIVFHYTDERGDFHAVTGIQNVPVEYRDRVKVADGKKLSTYKEEPVAIASAPARPAAEKNLEGKKLRGRPGGSWNSNQIEWVPWKSAISTARRKGKPICLTVVTDWCPHCKEYERVFHRPEVAEAAQDFVMVRANSDFEPEMDAYPAGGGKKFIPRTIFLPPSGRYADHFAPGSDYNFNSSNGSGGQLAGAMKEALARLGKTVP